MKRIFIAVALAVGLATALPAAAQDTPTYVEGATIVDPAAAKVLLDKGVKFVDVRGRNFFEREHIPGAVMLDLLDGFTEQNLLKVAAKTDEVVIYCEGPG